MQEWNLVVVLHVGLAGGNSPSESKKEHQQWYRYQLHYE